MLADQSGITVLAGASNSAKSALALQCVSNAVSKCDRNAMILCTKLRMQQHPPTFCSPCQCFSSEHHDFMNTRADVPPDLSLDFHRVGIKYTKSAANILDFFANIHLLDTPPDFVLIDNISDFLPTGSLTDEGIHLLSSILATISNAVLYCAPKKQELSLIYMSFA